MAVGGVNPPAATVCAEVIFVFGRASWASCSQDWGVAAGVASPAPTACALGTMAPLTAKNVTIANVFTGSSFSSYSVSQYFSFICTATVWRREHILAETHPSAKPWI